jgi:hypothetical protein
MQRYVSGVFGVISACILQFADAARDSTGTISQSIGCQGTLTGAAGNLIYDTHTVKMTVMNAAGSDLKLPAGHFHRERGVRA